MMCSVLSLHINDARNTKKRYTQIMNTSKMSIQKKSAWQHMETKVSGKGYMHIHRQPPFFVNANDMTSNSWLIKGG